MNSLEIELNRLSQESETFTPGSYIFRSETFAYEKNYHVAILGIDLIKGAIDAVKDMYDPGFKERVTARYSIEQTEYGVMPREWATHITQGEEPLLIVYCDEAGARGAIDARVVKGEYTDQNGKHELTYIHVGWVSARKLDEHKFDGDGAWYAYNALEELALSNGILVLNAGIVNENEPSKSFHYRRFFYKAPSSEEIALSKSTPGVYIKGPKILEWVEPDGTKKSTIIEWYTKKLY